MNQMEEAEDVDFANVLVAVRKSGSTTTSKTVLPEKTISYMKNLIATKFNPTAIAVIRKCFGRFIMFSSRH